MPTSSSGWGAGGESAGRGAEPRATLQASRKGEASCLIQPLLDWATVIGGRGIEPRATGLEDLPPLKALFREMILSLRTIACNVCTQEETRSRDTWKPQSIILLARDQ